MIEQWSQALARTDLIGGLRTLPVELRVAVISARIRIIGCAVIAVTINAERAANPDIEEPLNPAARRLADRHGWPQDRINDTANVFLPTGYGARTAGRVSVHDDGQIRVQITAPETLLVVKRHAAQRRGNRDAPTYSYSPAAVSPPTGRPSISTRRIPWRQPQPRTVELVEGVLALEQPAPASPRLLRLS